MKTEHHFRDGGNMVDDGLIVLPLWRRVWICVRNFRAWQTRVAMDRAICLMLRNGIETQKAYELLKISKRLWAEEFERQNSKSRKPASKSAESTFLNQTHENDD